MYWFAPPPEQASGCLSAFSCVLLFTLYPSFGGRANKLQVNAQVSHRHFHLIHINAKPSVFLVILLIVSEYTQQENLVSLFAMRTTILSLPVAVAPRPEMCQENGGRPGQALVYVQ